MAFKFEENRKDKEYAEKRRQALDELDVYGVPLKSVEEERQKTEEAKNNSHNSEKQR